jgi:hypothetical protein
VSVPNTTGPEPETITFSNGETVTREYYGTDPIGIHWVMWKYTLRNPDGVPVNVWFRQILADAGTVDQG